MFIPVWGDKFSIQIEPNCPVPLWPHPRSRLASLCIQNESTLSNSLTSIIQQDHVLNSQKQLIHTSSSLLKPTGNPRLSHFIVELALYLSEEMEEFQCKFPYLLNKEPKNPLPQHLLSLFALLKFIAKPGILQILPYFLKDSAFDCPPVFVEM